MTYDDVRELQRLARELDVPQMMERRVAVIETILLKIIDTWAKDVGLNGDTT